jgi:pyruvate dehydrogenase E2 component (dihydrolipoamide acetyltransferase)
MPREFKLPDLGEGIHEGEVIDVLVSQGDEVEDGQTVMVIETDKADTEVPSPVTGLVKEIKVAKGDVVNVGEVLMTFDVKEEAEEAVEAEEEEKAEAEEKKAERKEEEEEKKQEKEAAAEEKRAREAAKERKPKEPERKEKREREGPVPAAPSTRRLARELGVDLREVEPSGPGGRVLAEDVRAYAEKPEKKEEVPEKPPEKKAPPAAPSVEVPALPDFSQWGPVERQPLRSVRRTTAKRMQIAWAQIPHVTHQDVADVTELEKFRLRHKEEAESRGGALTFTVFMLKAVVAALKAYPRFNASLDMEAEEIIYKKYYHIGVAVDTDKGLLVPVVRDVDRKNLMELSKELYDLAERTRAGDASREEMTGGTLTITNIGPLGGTGFSPIINYPQVAILGMARAKWQPVVLREGERTEIVPRLMLPLILGFDHRIADGANAARFLNVIIEALSDPERLMMAM